MKLDFNKLDLCLKQKKMTYKELFESIGVSKTTFWAWKTGKREIKEIYIRAIARVLDIAVNKFSDLPDEVLISEEKLSDNMHQLVNLINTNTFYDKSKFLSMHKALDSLESKLANASAIIKGLTSSMESIFYVKDTNLEYVIVSKGFLKNLSLNQNYDVLGKKDEDFYPLGEAKKNEDEDRDVLFTGRSIKNKERFLPGSKKKKWAIISKYPILDNDRRIEGILAVQIDITDRKIAEKARELLEVHVFAMSRALVIYDLQKKRYVYMNKTMGELTGYSVQSLMKLDCHKFAKLLLHPKYLENGRVEQKLYGNYSEINHSTHQLVRKNGEVIWVYATREKLWEEL